jgi:hypothetical protein
MMQSCLEYSRVNDDLYAKVRGNHENFVKLFEKGIVSRDGYFVGRL